MNSPPASATWPRCSSRRNVRQRPPTRSRASSSVTSQPLRSSSNAAVSPASPAPTTTTRPRPRRPWSPPQPASGTPAPSASAAPAAPATIWRRVRPRDSFTWDSLTRGVSRSSATAVKPREAEDRIAVLGLGVKRQAALRARLSLEHAVLAGLQEVRACGPDEQRQEEARHRLHTLLHAEHLAGGVVALPGVPVGEERRHDDDRADRHRDHRHDRVLAELGAAAGLAQLCELLVHEVV